MGKWTLTVETWNIHQQGGKGRGAIPGWVVDEIRGADMAILTEFCTETLACMDGRRRFIQRMEEAGYQCCASDNKDGNDILIAVKKEYPVQFVGWCPCYKEGGCEDPDRVPENLRVDIDVHGTTVTIFGVRIKDVPSKNNKELREKGIEDTKQAEKRLTEFNKLLEWVEKKMKGGAPVIVAGDFNNYRRGTTVKKWNIGEIKKLAEQKGLALVSPEHGGSWGGSSSEFAEDHFLVAGMTCQTLFPYDRNFAKGEEGKKRGYLDGDLSGVPVGIPDHAILRGEFTLG